jgi:hypothetical protein
MKNPAHAPFPQFLVYIQWLIWVSRFAQADKYGLPRINVKHKVEGDFIKGHLNISDTLKYTWNQGCLASDYYVKEYQKIICLIVYKAYLALYHLSSEIPIILPPSVKQSIHQMSSIFKSVHNYRVTEAEYFSIRYRNIDISWKPLVDLSWQIIQNDNFTQSFGENGGGIFIDMADIWEQYLRKILTNELGKFGWTLHYKRDSDI